MKRLAAAALAVGLLCEPALADTGPTISGVVIDAADPAWPEYRWQRAHGAPPIKYWETIAHCETRQNWKNGGRWAGGLGIMTSKRFPERGMGTWERWGGEMFAPRPDQATPLQQIVVANRIAMFGWDAQFRRWDGREQRVRLKRYDKNPAGFRGWGCITNRIHLRSHSPVRFEQRRPRPRLVYQVVELTVPLAVPRWAYDRLPVNRLK